MCDVKNRKKSIKIRAGIIGCGKIAQVRHIPEYLANEQVQLVGYYDRNFKRAEELAERYGGKAYPDYHSLLAEEGIDAVSVCTANHLHAEIANAALRAGKHVLCEKPMAVTMEECEAMVRTAKEMCRCLMIGQNQRFAKAHKKAKALLAEGAIGELLSFRTTFGHAGPETWSINQTGKDLWFFDEKAAGMGVMGDLGIHKTDLIQYLTGQRIREVTAKLATLDKKDDQGRRIKVDDQAICIYTLEGGAVGTMTASWAYYGQEDNSTILYGTRGIMRIYDNPDYSIRIFRDGETVSYDQDRMQTNDCQTASGVIDEFVDCLLTGREASVSGEDALYAMKAVFAAIESSRSGQAVTIL